MDVKTIGAIIALSIIDKVAKRQHMIAQLP